MNSDLSAEQQLREAIAILNDLNETRVALAAQIRATARRAETLLGATAAARMSDEQPFPSAYVREMYWNQPDVHVDEIARVTGLQSVHEVIRIAGPGHFESPCIGGCGRVVARDVKSRSDASRGAISRLGSTDPRRCPECQSIEKAKEEQRSAEWSRSMAAEHNARRATLQAAIDAGLEPTHYYVEYPGVPGTWAIEEAADMQ